MEAVSLQSIFAIALPLFLIMDPVGNAVMCLAMLKHLPIHRQRQVLLRELVIALIIIVFFHYVGEWLLGILEIHQSTLRLSGGIILFMISIKMVFPPANSTQDEAERDPFIVPIAVPFIAGPSLLAAVMLYAHRAQAGALGSPNVLLGIMAAWGATAGILLCAPELTRMLGKRGMRAAERLMGLILVFLAVQMLEDGITMYIATLT